LVVKNGLKGRQGDLFVKNGLKVRQESLFVKNRLKVRQEGLLFVKNGLKGRQGGLLFVKNGLKGRQRGLLLVIERVKNGLIKGKESRLITSYRTSTKSHIYRTIPVISPNFCANEARHEPPFPCPHQNISWGFIFRFNYQRKI